MAAPPTYQTATSAANPGERDVVPVDVKGAVPPHSQPANGIGPAPARHIFPAAFGFYRAPGSHSDMCIALSAADAQSRPLFHISTHGGFSSKPSIVLHSSPSPKDPAAPLATADFHSFSSTVDITAQNSSIALTKDGAFPTSYSFVVRLPNDRQEKFVWKNSSGSEVSNLHGKSHGMKLERAATKEVCVAWAPPNKGTKKRGKMAFFAGNGSGDPRDEFGALWEILVVVSIAALMEGRRRRSNAAAGAAAGGGGGGGA